MSTDSAIGLTALLADKIQLPCSVAELHTRYRNAKPFPHVVIDNLFSEQLLNRVLAEAPTMAREQWLASSRRRLRFARTWSVCGR